MMREFINNGNYSYLFSTDYDISNALAAYSKDNIVVISIFLSINNKVFLYFISRSRVNNKWMNGIKNLNLKIFLNLQYENYYYLNCFTI